MHNFSKKKKGLFISSETKQLLICLTTSSIQWLALRQCSRSLIVMDVLHCGLFHLFYKMIGTSEYTCMCLCVCQYVCNTIHAHSATKFRMRSAIVLMLNSPVFRQRPLGIFTHTWLTVFCLCFMISTHLFRVSGITVLLKERDTCLFLTPLLRNTSQPLLCLHVQRERGITTLNRDAILSSSNNTKLLEVASLNMNTVDGVYAFTQMSPVTIMLTCISVF